MDIHCPNCKYEGAAKQEGSGFARVVVMVLLVGLSCFLPFFWLITIPLFFYFMIKGKPNVCPVCKWKNPIPLEHFRKTAQEPKLAGTPESNPVS